MELVLIVAIWTLILGGSAAYGKHVNQQRRQLFDGFAQRNKGYLLPDGTWFGALPEVLVQHRGRTVRVAQTSTGGKHPVFYIEATLDLRSLNPHGRRIEIYPETFTATLGKLLGMQDLEIGVAAFDARYILKANDPPTLEWMLDATARGAVDALYDLFGGADVHVHLDRHKLLVKKPRVVENASDLEWVLRWSRVVFDAALRALDAERLLAEGPSASQEVGGDEGIQFLEPVEGVRMIEAVTAALPQGTCLVCGEDLQGRVLVACARCGTGHHRDCWEYSGRCATYGCASVRYRRG